MNRGLHSFTWLTRGLGSPGACAVQKRNFDSQKHPWALGVPQTMRFCFWGGVGMHFLYRVERCQTIANFVSWECHTEIWGWYFFFDVFESQTSSHHLSAVFPTMLLVYRAQQGGGVLTLKSTTERLCPFVWKGWLNNVPLVHGQLVNPSNFNCKSREQLHATSIFNLPVHLKLVMHLAGLVFVFFLLCLLYEIDTIDTCVGYPKLWWLKLFGDEGSATFDPETSPEKAFWKRRDHRILT